MNLKDNYFLGICKAVASASKDESTKLGAVIVGSANEIRSTGYNSFPRGINDHVSERQVRPEKYKWFCHAEANAIYNAARVGTPLDGSRLYCQWLPCPHCAMAIIGAGIREVIVQSFEVPERWQGDMEIAVTMLGEAGIRIRIIGNPEPWLPEMVLEEGP